MAGPLRRAELFEGRVADPDLDLLLPPGSQPQIHWREADGHIYRP